MGIDYKLFLNTKKLISPTNGIDVLNIDLSQLYDFQQYIVKWALEKGRAAIFADCGMGKSPMQLKWAKNIVDHTNGKVLITAPLAVSQQTIREGIKFGIDVKYVRNQNEIDSSISITNYEMLKNFNGNDFKGVVLDESSILKSFDGKIRRQINETFKNTPYRLACTATPAPNDIIEIANHSDFLGIANQKEMLALFFIQDGNSTKDWKLKNYAEHDFYQWLSSWSVALQKPSDFGYDDTKFILPELHVKEHYVNADLTGSEMLLPIAVGLQEFNKIRKSSIKDRCDKVSKLINPDESTLIWCELNEEGNYLEKIIPNSVQIKGSDSIEKKEDILMGFSAGKYKILITKPSIAGFGLNWQHCHHMIFCGLSHSYEKYYQAIRRCWRFGQINEVNVDIVATKADENVVELVKHKEREAMRMMGSIIQYFKGFHHKNIKRKEYSMEINKLEHNKYTIYNGDSFEVIKDIDSESIGHIVFSPPFPAMYAYTDRAEDMGNSKNIDELLNHFEYMISDLNRILMPGRNIAIHLTQMPMFKRDYGHVGLIDYRGKIIQMFQDHDMIYYSEVTINKNPQVKAIRTKDSTLTFQGLARDSSKSRPAMADYLLIFRKKGENPFPIKAGTIKRYGTKGWISDLEWKKWAEPVWNDISETNVLNYRDARSEDDEKHLCPLQLDVIERCIKLWSNPGEIIFSPFAGIGSEGYEAIKWNRKFIGIELKKEYFKQMEKNLNHAVHQSQSNQEDLFSEIKEA